MPNVLLKIKYDGTAYHGWQVQKNATSVQQALQDAIENVFLSRPDVKGCSRTDAGVHAKEYCVSVNLPWFNSEYQVVSALNNTLPSDIRVFAAQVVSDEFHARYFCKGKEYVYTVHNSRISDPFTDRFTYLYKQNLDVDLLNTAAQHFVGKHDFKCFCNTKSDVEDTVRTVTTFTVKREGDFVKFTVSADGFLYNMVRIMVGTLLAVNSKKISAEGIDELLNSTDRKLAGKTVPAKGLVLNRVFY